jgi:hypothetical protein
MCKTEILEIKLDREFDTLINGDTLPTFVYPNEVLIKNYYYNEIEHKENIDDPGLVIKNNLKGPGVIITQIKSSGLFIKYNFKKDDIILFINEVPCVNHIKVMNQIMNLFQSGKPMKIIKL